MLAGCGWDLWLAKGDLFLANGWELVVGGVEERELWLELWSAEVGYNSPSPATTPLFPPFPHTFQLPFHCPMFCSLPFD